MKKKIFSKIFFEKKKYLTLYLCIIIFFMIFVCIQSILIDHQYQVSIYPDIEVYGNPDADGVIRFKKYNDVGNIADELKNELGNSIDVQGTIVRNLVTISHSFDVVDYQIMGMKDETIKFFDKYIIEGKLPKKGKKEVVLGKYAANYFHLKVGDTVPFHVTLDPTVDTLAEGEHDYVVSGILNDNLKYFKGNMIISKETWIADNLNIKDNFVMIYIDNNEEYNKVIDCLNDLSENSENAINVRVNYMNKSATSGIFNSRQTTLIIISIFVMILLFVYLLRGMVKKIGLLKALGLSNKVILQTFYRGLTIITVIAVVIGMIGGKIVAILLNNNASKFYGFSVTEYNLSSNTVIFVLILNIINITIVCLTTTFICMKISPRAAMIKV